MMQKKNYYLLLGLKNTSSADEIKAAYRALAKKYHPDKNQGNKASEEYFKEIQEAYATLSNPEKKRKYDLSFSTARLYSKQPTQTPYAGNAYKYAQQQAQQKKRGPQKSTTVKKEDKAESIYLLISIGIALLLLYFIISYSVEKR